MLSNNFAYSLDELQVALAVRDCGIKIIYELLGETTMPFQFCSSSLKISTKHLFKDNLQKKHLSMIKVELSIA